MTDRGPMEHMLAPTADPSWVFSVDGYGGAELVWFAARDQGHRPAGLQGSLNGLSPSASPLCRVGL